MYCSRHDPSGENVSQGIGREELSFRLVLRNPNGNGVKTRENKKTVCGQFGKLQSSAKIENDVKGTKVGKKRWALGLKGRVPPQEPAEKNFKRKKKPYKNEKTTSLKRPTRDEGGKARR